MGTRGGQQRAVRTLVDSSHTVPSGSGDNGGHAPPTQNAGRLHTSPAAHWVPSGSSVGVQAPVAPSHTELAWHTTLEYSEHTSLARTNTLSITPRLPSHKLAD
jgi:hypothetical protein